MKKKIMSLLRIMKKNKYYHQLGIIIINIANIALLLHAVNAGQIKI
jgi:hypothetical protein